MHQTGVRTHAAGVKLLRAGRRKRVERSADIDPLPVHQNRLIFGTGLKRLHHPWDHDVGDIRGANDDPAIVEYFHQRMVSDTPRHSICATDAKQPIVMSINAMTMFCDVVYEAAFAVDPRVKAVT